MNRPDPEPHAWVAICFIVTGVCVVCALAALSWGAIQWGLL